MAFFINKLRGKLIPGRHSHQLESDRGALAELRFLAGERVYWTKLDKVEKNADNR
jgi:hypothetical protein